MLIRLSSLTTPHFNVVDVTFNLLFMADEISHGPCHIRQSPQSAESDSESGQFLVFQTANASDRGALSLLRSHILYVFTLVHRLDVSPSVHKCLVFVVISSCVRLVI